MNEKLVEDYIALFIRVGIRSYAIKRNKIDDRSFEGLRVVTMHRVKGLEFKYVFIAAMNSGMIPPSSAINRTDSVSEAESIISEKCLLYVAMTRAQKGVYITSYGRKSAQATIQCAVFKGTDRDVFIDRREYGGDIVTQLDAAYDYVLRNIHMSSEINGLYRTDIYELPTDCIREMICDAVVHRSYLHPASIQVAVYDDRVEVTSPGMLFGSLRLQDIREGISIPRNRALVYAFTYMNIMEHWGSGIPRIIRRCKELGLEESELMEIAGNFRMNLFRFPDKTRIGKSTEKVRISTDNLNENHKKIIQYIEERGTITNKEVQNLLNVKDSRALKILKELVEAGALKKEGKLRGSYYKLK